jgi:hypothetical protein
MNNDTRRKPLTTDQVREAVQQMRVHCDLKMVDYELVSARAALYELGYHGEDAEQVLKALYDGGFTYCLDVDYHTSPRDNDGPISPDVCYWGPDQLRSRLDSVHLP